ncbi:hypothetical protein H4W32_002752 [Actinophytocola algeriensis]|uniref:Uncharacterized protein n=1 Tax=Actinophytocola algeriensis TaxID=1768010 RepID=A0A7W7Q8G1_9PSEU|nr:hypothetical protein [Actinophytocola algeriensis]MBE1474710.1 hypothetical protein [Actinophytocola algeriensis]
MLKDPFVQSDVLKDPFVTVGVMKGSFSAAVLRELGGE